MYVNQIFDPVHSKNYIWDTDSLSWVAQTASDGGTGGGDVTVTNWPASQTISDGGLSITVDGSVTVDNLDTVYTVRLEESGDIMYVGEAIPGALENATVWRIKKVDSSSGTSVKWAGGSSNFINRWDQRTGLTYS